MTAVVESLEVGSRYRIRYRLDGQRRERVFVGTYLGRQYESELVFNQRPAAGTGTIPSDALISAMPVGNDVPHSQPVMA